MPEEFQRIEPLAPSNYELLVYSSARLRILSRLKNVTLSLSLFLSLLKLFLSNLKIADKIHFHRHLIVVILPIFTFFTAILH